MNGELSTEPREDERRTARVTGLWYLALAVLGVLGFLVLRPQIHVVADPAATLANLVEREAVARLGLVLELALVVAQALAAVWFYKLFHSLNRTAAFALAVFGVVNAVAIMVSAVFTATALSVAAGTTPPSAGDAANTVQLLYELSSQSWGVGSLFFGLWLIPMGHVAASSNLMPRFLGRLLIVGGAGYLLSSFISYGFGDAATWLSDLLVIPATVGEFWMIGYLLLIGLRESYVSPKQAVQV